MERRLCDREPTNVKVYVGDPPYAKMLQARDISPNGVFLEGWVDPPACGAELTLAFVIDNNKPLVMRRRAKVARITNSGVGLTHDMEPYTPPPRTRDTWSALSWPIVE